MPKAAWIRTERAAHRRALAAPQPFLLTGDGPETRAVIAAPPSSTELGPALAEARYRDWQKSCTAKPKRRHLTRQGTRA